MTDTALDAHPQGDAAAEPGAGASGAATTAPASAPLPPHRKRNATLIAGTMVIDGVDSTILGSLFPVIQASLGLASSALGILVAASRLASVVTGPLWVALTRYLSRKQIIAIVGGLWGAWGIAAGLSQNFVQLLILYTIASAGFVVGQIFLPGLVGDSFPVQRRGRVIGWVYGIVALSGSLASPLLGALSRIPDGWRLGFIVFGALNVVFGVLTLLFFRDPGVGALDGRTDGGRISTGRERDLRWAHVWSGLRIPTFAILTVSRFISPQAVLSTFAVLILVDAHGLSVQTATLALAPFGIGYLLGVVVVGYVGDRVARLHPAAGRIVLLQGAQFAFALFAFLATQFTYAQVAWYAVFAVLVGLFQGVNPPLNRTILLAVVPAELRNAAFGTVVVVEAASFAVLSLVTGFLADAIGVQAAVFWTVIVVVTVNGCLLGALYGPYRRDSARAARAVGAPVSS